MGDDATKDTASNDKAPKGKSGWLKWFVESYWTPLFVIMTGLIAVYSFIIEQIDQLRDETVDTKRATLKTEERISLEEKSLNQT